MNGFEQLSLLLEKTIEAKKKLLALETSKTDILVRGDVRELDEVLKLEQPFIMEAAGMEKRRIALQEKMKLGDTTLKEIIRLYDAQNKYFLKTRFDELSALLLELKKVNRVNMAILNSRVTMLNQFVSLIGLKDPALTYQKDGHTKP